MEKSNPNFTEEKTVLKKRKRRTRSFKCHLCKTELPFCWNCPCGFQICEKCMEENRWGMSNGPTWICPDCERVRMF